MNKKFLSTALAISLLGMCGMGFNNSVLAGGNKKQTIRKIKSLNRQYATLYLQERETGNVEPVETWRTHMLELFNELPEADRPRTFAKIVKGRNASVDSENITGSSAIVRIPCPLNRVYTRELISQFLTSENQLPEHPSNGTSILAMRLSFQNDPDAIYIL